MKYIFRTRFNWVDVLLMVSTYPLVATIGWWTLLVMLIGSIFSAAVSVKLEVA